METVKIADVKKNARDWYEISLDGDDRVLATKDSKLADVANASIGADVEVVVNSRPNGNYTNHYLQEIGGVKETRSPRAAGSASRPAGKSPEVQADIAKQWALGRAVETLMASSEDFGFPLSPPVLEALTKQAQAFLDARGNLKV